MTRARAFAKINLALVVGPVRPDGKHEVATVLQAIDLWDDIELTPADALTVDGVRGGHARPASARSDSPRRAGVAPTGAC